MTSNSRILICGKNFHARAAFRKLRTMPEAGQVIGFIDTESASKNIDFMGLPVFGLTDLSDSSFDQIVVAGRYVDEMQKNLLAHAIPNEKIREMKRTDYQPTKLQMEPRSQQTQEILLRLLRLLNELDINYWFLASSLLAIERKQDLAWFGDVDIAIPVESMAILSNSLDVSDRFALVERQKQSHDGPFWQAGSLYQIMLRSETDIIESEPAIFDVHALFLHDGLAYYATGNAIFLSADERHFLGSETTHFSDIAMRVPLDRHAYLSSTYGTNWDLPSESFRASDHIGRKSWSKLLKL